MACMRTGPAAHRMHIAPHPHNARRRARSPRSGTIVLASAHRRDAKLSRESEEAIDDVRASARNVGDLFAQDRPRQLACGRADRRDDHVPSAVLPSNTRLEGAQGATMMVSVPSAHESGTARSAPLPAFVIAVLAILVVGATCYGLVAPDAYRTVPELLRQTWRAEDAVSLASIPLLVLAWRRARAGSIRAYLVTTGLLMWLAYAYAHLAFAVPFNAVFPLYVAILGTAGYGALDGLVRADVGAVQAAFARAPRKVAAWFLMVSSVAIAGLWLSDIAVGVLGGTPANLHLSGLPNPTWVIDLAWVVPVAFAAGIRLRRGRAEGLLLGGVMLVMLTALSLSMLSVVPFALIAGLGSDSTVARQLVAFTGIFTVLGSLEVGLLAVSVRRAMPAPTARAKSVWWMPRNSTS